VTATRYSTLMGACFLLPPVGLLMQQNSRQPLLSQSQYLVLQRKHA
jgi:hypothetical protein